MGLGSDRTATTISAFDDCSHQGAIQLARTRPACTQTELLLLAPTKWHPLPGAESFMAPSCSLRAKRTSPPSGMTESLCCSDVQC